MKKKNKCIDCGKNILLESTRCTHCSKLGKLHPGYLDGRTSAKRFCEDCGIKIDSRAKRCVSCYNQLRKTNSSRKHHCINCHKEISSNTVKRCQSCAQKFRFRKPGSNPMFGVHRFGKENPMYGVRRFGILNPNYIDGRSFEPYSLEFNEQLKEQIRKRDNYKCQNCNITEDEHLKLLGQVLHIHHIDYNKQNCKKNNLITLCNKCNVKANKNREYWKNYYQERICLLV